MTHGEPAAAQALQQAITEVQMEGGRGAYLDTVEIG